MKLDLIKKAALFLFFVFLLTPFLVKAITFINPLCPPGNPTCDMTIANIIDRIINFIFYIGVAIFPIMAIIAGFLFLSSSGEPAKVRTAKTILFYALLGLLIILLARGLISVLKGMIGAS
jgi:hypothetical protein